MEGYRLFSIDPGTSSLGLSVLEIPIYTNQRCAKAHEVMWLDSMTLRCDPFIKEFTHMAQTHGDRFAKLTGIEHYLLTYMEYWQPHGVASESPYMGRFPQAYAALTECIYAIRKAVIRYNSLLPLNLIDPATVKQSIGVSGKSGDKDKMRSAIKFYSDCFIKSVGVDLERADEHAVDALAVGIAYASSHGLLCL